MNKVTFLGNPLTLKGEKVKVGEVAPNFTCIKSDLTPFNLSDLDGKVRIISAVPSVDTDVCELQTVRFNKEAKEIPELKVITVSVDLPFAHSKFCANKGIENSILVSDHKDLDFAKKYGLEIEELRVLSRAIFVLDKEGVIKYLEYLDEVSNHPNYDLALEAAKKLI